MQSSHSASARSQLIETDGSDVGVVHGVIDFTVHVRL